MGEEVSLLLGRHDGKPELELEGGSNAQATLDANGGTHALEEDLGDGETEASAAESARRGGVGLVERDEEAGQGGVVHAHARVGDTERDTQLLGVNVRTEKEGMKATDRLLLWLRRADDLEPNRTLQCELGGVVEEVRQGLGKPVRITEDAMLAVRELLLVRDSIAN